MRHHVELEELLAFVDKLQDFEKRAEQLATRVDGAVAALHDSWEGRGAGGHRAMHDEWMAAAGQMREALTQLTARAHNAHRNYTDAIQLNLAMLA